MDIMQRRSLATLQVVSAAPHLEISNIVTSETPKCALQRDGSLRNVDVSTEFNAVLFKVLRPKGFPLACDYLLRMQTRKHSIAPGATRVIPFCSISRTKRRKKDSWLIWSMCSEKCCTKYLFGSWRVSIRYRAVDVSHRWPKR